MQLHENQYYHIYNRGNNGENIFFTEKNYRYFMQKYAFYLDEYLETFAYCLMPNHFHLLVKVRERRNLPGLEDLAGLSTNLISQKFSNFFNSYTKSINKQENRHGSLFEKPFKRKNIKSDEYFQTLVYYIHNNPVHHGFTKNIVDWEWSSYHSILSDKKTKIQREEVIEWFHSKHNFLEFHSNTPSLKKLGELCIE